jgi:UDP-glucose 4-epimerase
MRSEGIRRLSEKAETLWLEHLLPVLRERLFDEKLIGSKYSRRLLDLSKHVFKLSRVPFFQEHLPEFDPLKSNLSWLPINQNIEGAGEIALPVEVLDRLIEKASHRVIVNFCGCRKAMNCPDYPVDIGCLMMGESALEIPVKSRREVGVEEAKQHVRKAIQAGLIPVTGKARIDNDIFMIPDEGKLLTVCLCCECCCITRFSRYAPQEVLDRMHHPVEGLSIQVTDDCIGCGACVSACYINAIRLDGDRAVISGMCRVCGRCAMHCPQDAIKLTLSNPNAVEDVVRRIESAVDF